MRMVGIVKSTRGWGLFEGLLSQWRGWEARKALIPGKSILDIGCGPCPQFVLSLDYKTKWLLDPAVSVNSIASLDKLKEGVDCITMLAVLEHMDLKSGYNMIQEAYKKLKWGGVLVITTPNAWTARLLERLAWFDIVSKKEIDDHKQYYNEELLGWSLRKFRRVDIKTFMLGMNLVVRAVK